MPNPHLRNVAVIAHVDHGKTTLTDQMLYQSGMFRDADLDKLAGGQHNLIMDTGDLERERGITITSKVCAIRYTSEGPRGQGAEGPRERQSDSDSPHSAPRPLDPLAPSSVYKFNLIDTPGHADFGGEVERVLKMADGVLLLVDSFEGPMPQTRFVLQKALGHGLRPLVVVNKVDKPNARPDDVVNEVFDLLGDLGADDEALDFPTIYASAKEAWATADLDKPSANLKPLFEAIIEHVPPPAREESDTSAPLQMLITTVAYSDYVGRIGIGRVFAGRLRSGQPVTVLGRDGSRTKQKAQQVQVFDGLSRVDAEDVEAGDICAIIGLDPIDIGDTVACPDEPGALPQVAIDEPTLSMTFLVNTSPFAGREGKFVTSRQIKDRLDKELQSNVALRVEPGESPEQFHVSGRGLMHLGVLLETMRREGYELAVGKPRVIYKRIDGTLCEPIEQLVVDCPSECQNDVLSLVTPRKAQVVRMDPKIGAGDYVHLEFTLPARGLIGLRTRMLTATQGRAIMHHNLLAYEPTRGEVPKRPAGVIVSSATGAVTGYSLSGLYDRGVFFVRPGDNVYEGQVIGEHCKDNDIIANPIKGKKLSAVRMKEKDDNLQVRPPRDMSLEACLEYIEEDELVEITPKSIRLRKRLLGESARRRDSRAAKAMVEV